MRPHVIRALANATKACSHSIGPAVLGATGTALSHRPVIKYHIATLLDWFNANSDGVQTMLALLAGVAASVWWLMRREHNYRANLELKLEHVDLKNGSHLYRVLVVVANVGLKKMEIDRAKLFIQRVVPVAGDLSLNWADRCCEFPWPALKQFDGTLPCRQDFEPGESGPIVFDFVIEDQPEVVSVYVLLNNKSLWWRRLFGREDYGWNIAQIFRLTHEQKQSAIQPPAPAEPRPEPGA